MASPVAAVDLQPLVLPIRTGEAALAIGTAFDPITNTSGAVLLPSLPSWPATNSTPGGQTQEQYSFIANAASYTETVNASASVYGSYDDTISGSAAVQYAQQQTLTSSTVLVMVELVSVGASSMPTPYPTPSTNDTGPIVQQIKDGGYENFIDTNGSHFVAGVIYGASYVGISSAQFSTAAQATQFSAEASADYNGVLSSAKAQAAYTQQAQSIDSQVTLSGFQIGTGFPMQGGDGTIDPTTLVDNVLAFTAGTPLTPIAYILYDWRMIPAINSAISSSNPPYIDNSTEYLANLGPVGQYLSGLQYLLAVANSAALNSPQTPNNPQALQSMQNQLQSLISGTGENNTVLGIENYTPADVASFQDSTLGNLVTYQEQLNAAVYGPTANGAVNVTITAYVDSTFTSPTAAANPNCPISGVSGPGSGSQAIYSITATVPAPAQGDGSSGVWITLQKASASWTFKFLYSGVSGGICKGTVELIDPLENTVTQTANWNPQQPFTNNSFSARSTKISYIQTVVTYS